MHLENNHCISNGYFDRKYCDEIISQAETSKLHMAKVQDGLNINRKSKITWLTNDKLNKNINEIILDHNKKAKWNFVLKEFEPLQYTAYETNDHYDWHIDIGPGAISHRKVSVVVQLSDSSEYTGGILEVSTGSNSLKVSNKKGAVILFPSFLQHRVTPVASGLRKSLFKVFTSSPQY